MADASCHVQARCGLSGADARQQRAAWPWAAGSRLSLAAAVGCAGRMRLHCAYSCSSLPAPAAAEEFVTMRSATRQLRKEEAKVAA